ncbi:MAG: ArnT family glycosyltransferase [bacterium]
MFSFFWNLLVSYDSILISAALTIPATFYGWYILKFITGRTAVSLENLVFSIGLGFGFLSLLTFALGISNLLYLNCFLIIFIGLSLPVLYILIHRIIKKSVKFQPLSSCFSRSTLFWLIPILFLALVQLNIALLPPFEYDALEYHFGAPDYYLQQHKITYIPGNVYANFTANTEMLYTLGMVFNDDITGKLFHFYFGLLTALGLFALGKKLWHEATGAISALIFLGLPIVFQILYQANIDLALAGYSLLALFAVINWTNEKVYNDLLLAGIFIGFGLGCKYTAMLTIAIPICIIVIISAFIIPKSSIRNLKFGVWCLILGTCLPVLPWCIKNLIYTGNPVFPLFYSFFGGDNWSPELAKKFMDAHLSFNLIKPLYQDYSRICIVAILALIIPLKKDKYIRVMFLYLLFGYLLWFFFTEHIERFLMPVIPVIALGIGYLAIQYIQHRIFRRSLSIIAVYVVFYIGIKQLPGLPPVGLNKTEWHRQFILETKLSIYPTFEYLNDALPAHGNILFIAEARRHYLKHPAIMNTVFDRSPIFELAQSAKSPKDIYRGLQEMKVTHILYNPYELKRLTDFYGPYFNWTHPEQEQMLAAFFNQYTEPEWAYYAIKIYRLKT